MSGVLRGALVGVICLVTVAVGGCSDGSSDDEIVIGIAEAWVSGWQADDPAAVAAVFTEDGILVDPLGSIVTGRDAIASYVDNHDNIAGETCDYEVTETGDGTFTVPCFMKVNDASRPGQLAISIDGDLASQIQWMDNP